MLPIHLDLMNLAQPSRLDRLNQSFCAQDGNDPLDVIGQYIQAHFGTDTGQGFGQEVGITHPLLQCPKGMFDRRPTNTHAVGF